MLAQVLAHMRPVGTDDETQLAMRNRGRRDGIDRMLRIPRLEREHLERVPAKHPLCGRKSGFAPALIDRRIERIAADGDVGQRLPDGAGDGRGAQTVYEHDAVFAHDGRNGVRQNDCGIREQPAPVAGVVAAFAQTQREFEADRAAGTQKYGRPFGIDTRPVRRNQDVGGELVAQCGAYRVQPRGAHLLSGFEKQVDVESEPAAAGREHARERAEIDRMLALVVGCAAAVPAVAFDGDRPWIARLAPLCVVAEDDIAMAVHENGRQIGGFAASREQERSASGNRIVNHSLVVRKRDLNAARETQALRGRQQFVGEITAELCGSLGVLALGSVGDATAEVRAKRARIEIVRRMRERL